MAVVRGLILTVRIGEIRVDVDDTGEGAGAGSLRFGCWVRGLDLLAPLVGLLRSGFATDFTGLLLWGGARVSL